MDSVRFFKDLSKRQLRELRSNQDITTVLQSMQHNVAVDAGFRSWGALIAADEVERELAALMLREPTLTSIGFGVSNLAHDPGERRRLFVDGRTELRADVATVDLVRRWLDENIAPRQTINDHRTSYGLKHLAEPDIGYSTNGAFTAAAIIAGYPYRRPTSDSPNATFGMSERSITEVRRRTNRR